MIRARNSLMLQTVAAQRSGAGTGWLGHSALKQSRGGDANGRITALPASLTSREGGQTTTTRHGRGRGAGVGTGGDDGASGLAAWTWWNSMLRASSPETALYAPDTGQTPLRGTGMLQLLLRRLGQLTATHVLLETPHRAVQLRLVCGEALSVDDGCGLGEREKRKRGLEVLMRGHSRQWRRSAVTYCLRHYYDHRQRNPNG
jgi:hypothetical protein